jgi:hypothetical protein
MNYFDYLDVSGPALVPGIPDTRKANKDQPSVGSMHLEVAICVY